MNSPSAPETIDLSAQLSRIGLSATATALDDFIARATKARWSPRQILEEVYQVESRERARRSLERRLRMSGIKRFKPMSDFDWNWPRKVERDIIERAFTLDFIREGRNLILLGANGLGKTMIAKNIAYQAVLAGHSVLFRTASEIIESLQGDSPELRKRRLRAYVRPQLLCCDEVGYLSYDSHAADILYEVFNRRYEHRATIITTNRAFKDWSHIFPNASCIVTLLDRLTHHADITVIEGQSYRVRESEQEAAARRKNK